MRERENNMNVEKRRWSTFLPFAALFSDKVRNMKSMISKRGKIEFVRSQLKIFVHFA